MTHKKSLSTITVLLICLSLCCCSALGTAAPAPSATPIAAGTQPSATATPAQATASPAPFAPEPTPSPAPSATAAPTPTPDPDAQYFSASGETYSINPDGAHWSYKSPTLSISIEKFHDNSLKCTYYVADIHMKDGSLFSSGFANGKAPGHPARLPKDTARLYKAVYMQNGDYYSNADNHSGLVIRGGIVLKNARQVDDIMAVTPAGEMLVYHPGKVTKDQLLQMGVRDCFSFGPILVENGQTNVAALKHPLRGLNPRSGIGMVSRGHFIGIVVDGRQPNSKGISFENYAKLFIRNHCVVAYNMDGGQSAAMVFMGQPVNSPSKSLVANSTEHWCGQRSVPDVFYIGTSPLVPAK